MDDEVTHRIAQAQKAMHKLNNIWRSRELSVEVKMKIFTTMIRSVLTYALDAHVLTHTQMQRLEAAHTLLIRRAIRRPAHIDKENSTTLRTRVNVTH